MVRASRFSRLKIRMPIRIRATSATAWARATSQRTGRAFQATTRAWKVTINAAGTTMKLARRLAARTLVVLLETTTAPATIPTVSVTARQAIWPTRSGGMVRPVTPGRRRANRAMEARLPARGRTSAASNLPRYRARSEIGVERSDSSVFRSFSPTNDSRAMTREKEVGKKPTIMVAKGTSWPDTSPGL